MPLLGGLSAATTYYIAGQMLEKHTEVALRCLEFAAEKAVKEVGAEQSSMKRKWEENSNTTKLKQAKN